MSIVLLGLDHWLEPLVQERSSPRIFGSANPQAPSNVLEALCRLIKIEIRGAQCLWVSQYATSTLSSSFEAESLKEVPSISATVGQDPERIDYIENAYATDSYSRRDFISDLSSRNPRAIIDLDASDGAVRLLALGDALTNEQQETWGRRRNPNATQRDRSHICQVLEQRVVVVDPNRLSEHFGEDFGNEFEAQRNQFIKNLRAALNPAHSQSPTLRQ